MRDKPVQFSTPEQFFLGSTSRLHCQLPLPGMGNKEDSAAMRLVDLVSLFLDADASTGSSVFVWLLLYCKS
jgi:hypothetical protein